MQSFLIQKQVRDNSEDLQFYMKDLRNWEDDIKQKEAKLNYGEIDEDEIVPEIRTKQFRKIKKEKPKKCSRIRSGDYSAWDKFDVDAACEELDKEEHDDYVEVEEELSDDELERRTKQAYVQKEKGNQFVQKQQWIDAIKCYTKAIEYYQKDPVFYANRALCYLKLGKYSNAEIDCTSSLRLEPFYVKALQRRAAAKISLGQTMEAYNDLKEVLELEPNNKASKAELVKLEKKLKLDIQTKENKKSEEIKIDSDTMKTVTSENKPNEVAISEELSEEKKETAITNWKQQRGEIRNQLNENIWPGDQQVVLIKPIRKAPHLRSKKPLRRIQVTEIDLNIAAKFVEVPPPDDAIVTSVKNVVETEKSEKIPFTNPNTCFQFEASWKSLKSDSGRKFEFLMSIPAAELGNIFQEFLESDLFYDILSTLSENCNTDSIMNICNYLKALTKVKRFSTIIMFMSKREKEHILKILNFIQEIGGMSEDDTDFLKKNYEI